MLKHINVNLNLLAKEGKAYKWNRPSPCNCGHIFWGHGYVRRYFDNYNEAFWLKRYRCPNCKATITLFPKDYKKYFRYSFSSICKAISTRLKSYKWPPWCPRQCGGHWLRRFKLYCMGAFGVNEESLNLKVKIEELYNEKTDFLVR
jgi:hypothetical protein